MSRDSKEQQPIRDFFTNPIKKNEKGEVIESYYEILGVTKEAEKDDGQFIANKEMEINLIGQSISKIMISPIKFDIAAPAGVRILNPKKIEDEKWKSIGEIFEEETQGVNGLPRKIKIFKRKLAEIFHNSGDIFFELSNGMKICCERNQQTVFVTNQCAEAKGKDSDLDSKSGVKFNVKTHGIGCLEGFEEKISPLKPTNNLDPNLASSRQAIPQPSRGRT